MPTLSRNRRLKARTKRTNSLLKRSLKQAAFQANRNFSTVLMLLMQAGGEVTVSPGIVQNVLQSLGKAQFVIEPSTTEEGAAVIKVVAQEPVLDSGPQPLTAEMIADLKARMDARSSQAVDLPSFEAGSVTTELIEREAMSGERQDADGNTMSDVAPVQPIIDIHYEDQ